MPIKINKLGKWNGPLAPLILIISMIGSIQIGQVLGTPSTQIWNPSTDIQKSGTLHFGIDNYFSIVQNAHKPFQLYPDLGLTYGVFNYLEVGVDMIQPSADPYYFNFKFAYPESDKLPSFALGGFNFGTKSGVTDYNMLYGLAAKTFPSVGRLSIGYYYGMTGNLFMDEIGHEAKDGLMATWDKALTDKIWACIDYASGKSWYGSLSLGFSYAFSENVSVIFGYVLFNNHNVVPNNTFTTQLDINLF
jgi:hypothetical protein